MKYIARKPNDLPLPDNYQIVMTIMAWPEAVECKGENLHTDVLVFNTYSEAADTIYNLLEGEGYTTEQICSITIMCVQKSISDQE